MGKKGFTLIEILAVIVVLGLLTAMIAPVVNNLISDSEDALQSEQINTIINATKRYMIENSDLLPDDNSICVGVDDLINNGIIDNSSVIDPKTKELISGCVLVSYDNSFNQYTYDFVFD